VSVFHIIDYILKFYETGFTRQDIERANFMTTREELFPGRDVVGGLIQALEGRYIRPKDRRSAEYRTPSKFGEYNREVEVGPRWDLVESARPTRQNRRQ